MHRDGAGEPVDGGDALGFYSAERRERQRKLRRKVQRGVEEETQIFGSLAAVPDALTDLCAHEGVADLRRQKLFLQRYKIDNPYFRSCLPGPGGTAEVGGRQCAHFSGYDYLGLAQDARVREAAKAAVDAYGPTVSASRIASGDNALHRELEAAIAGFLGVEDSIVFISGYGTNVTTLEHLFGPGDLILCDAFAHNSLFSGCEASGATFMRFPHNDADAAERLLARHRLAYRRALIVIEGVYSMEGSIPDLPRFAALKAAYKALLMADEAHSLGTLGRQGRGIGEHWGMAPGEIDLWMGTLSKAFASAGGFIAGPHDFVDYLRYTAPGFIFSVGLSPADCGAALAAVRISQAEPWRREKLAENAERLRAAFRARGWNIGLSRESPVVPLIVGNSLDCLRLSGALYEAGVNVHPILYPGVPENQTRLRFFVSASHTAEQIDRTVEALAAALTGERT
ncbi:MAG: aminotransferase class I/II-fold pyridoxal phosphate-dependent enzyme [Rhodospirillaceae bacterium]